MLQNILLVCIVLLCLLLIISIIIDPFDNTINNCIFKILPPKYFINGLNRLASFSILVEKRHRYFINFPLSFKFYSDQKFKTFVRIKYSTHNETEQILLEKIIEFSSIVNEHVVYITDIIIEKMTIEIFLEVEYGNPIIEFEILQNNTCNLTKEHKLELMFS